MVKADTETQACSVCGAWLRVRNITYTQIIDDKVYIVSDVPAQVCGNCGEEYLTPTTVDAIQKTLESGTAKRTVSVPVYELASTSP